MQWLSDPGNLLIAFLIFIGAFSLVVWVYLRVDDRRQSREADVDHAESPVGGNAGPRLTHRDGKSPGDPDSQSLEQGTPPPKEEDKKDSKPGDELRSAPAVLPPTAVGGEGALVPQGSSADLLKIDPSTVEMSADEMLGPLRSILEMLGKVKGEGNLNAAQKQYLTVAQAKGRRMVAHIEDIDLMLRLHDGPVSLRQDTFSLREKLERLVRSASRMGERNQVSVSLSNFEKDRYLVRSDEKLFEKITGHLISSALRGIRDGKITIRLSSRLVSAPFSGTDFFYLDEDELEGQGVRTITIECVMPGAGSRSKALDTLARNLEKDAPETREETSQEPPEQQDVFALSLARELTKQLGGDLYFEQRGDGVGAFVLKLRLETFETGPTQKTEDRNVDGAGGFGLDD